MSKLLKKCSVILCGILLASLYTFSVFADVNYTDEKKYEQGFEVSDLVSNILVTLEKVPDLEFLNYKFEIDFEKERDLDYISTIQTQIIERLDGVLTVTPEVKLSISGNTINLKVRKYAISDTNYDVILNSLVEEAKLKPTDEEKIWVLGNYFYNNKFVYAYDHYTEYPNAKSSNHFISKNTMPDGVLSRGKGICIGYSNLMTDFCERVGIPCIKIRGYEVATNGYHEWCLCYLKYNGVYDWYSVEPQRGLHRLNHPNAIETLETCASDMNWSIDLQEDIINLKYSINDLMKYQYGYCFSDISNHWASDYIIDLFNRKVISGYTDGSFKPNNNITIAEFIQLIMNEFVPAEDRPNENSWWDGAYKYAIDNEIISVELFPEERVTDNITREEMAYIIQNVDKLIRDKEDVEKEDFSIIDEKAISEIFRENVYQCYRKGYIMGIDDNGTFNPKGLATRGQCAVILYRLLDENVEK